MREICNVYQFRDVDFFASYVFEVRLVTGGELRDKDCALAKLADAIYFGEPLPTIPKDNFKRKKK